MKEKDKKREKNLHNFHWLASAVGLSIVNLNNHPAVWLLDFDSEAASNWCFDYGARCASGSDSVHLNSLRCPGQGDDCFSSKLFRANRNYRQVPRYRSSERNAILPSIIPTSIGRKSLNEFDSKIKLTMIVVYKPKGRRHLGYSSRMISIELAARMTNARNYRLTFQVSVCVHRRIIGIW